MRRPAASLGAVGVAMGSLRRAALRSSSTSPTCVDAVLWLAGGVVVHDAVVAPLTIALTVLLRRVLPRASRTRVTVGSSCC